MAFKKTMQGKNIVVLGDSKALQSSFQPGFRYRVGGTIYTVIRDVSQDPTSSMRLVATSDGSNEIMAVETIVRDLKEADAQILPVDTKYVKTSPQEEIKKAPPKAQKTANAKKKKKARRSRA
jgi:hypothetical protein